ncbi:MAG: beta-N-acetylhexosaminidase [Nitrospinales bacterium]
MEEINLNTIIEQTGQMLMAGLKGTSIDKDAEELICKYKIGGFILFGRNFENPRQLSNFICDLQSLAISKGNGTPLFISVDQEGGRVARLKEPFTEYPFAGVLGIAKSEELAYNFGSALAKELLAVGINMDFAPVLDVNSNPENPIIGDRAFSDDPEWVARLGGAFIRAFNDEGILPVGKHFPGHGDTALDSHLDLPYVNRDVNSLEKIELHPFSKVLKNGLDVVMTAHVIYPAWDEKNPATFSKKILDDILRKRFGFDGIIISDDLEMKAIDDHYQFESIPAMGVEAGVDIFLVCHDTDRIRTLHDLLIKGMNTGKISRDNVQMSADRIARIKRKIKTTKPLKNLDDIITTQCHKIAKEMKSFLPS